LEQHVVSSVADTHRSIRVNGADCGVESILLGVVTSVGGFLFGYDTGQISGMLIFEDFRNRFATGEPAAPGEPPQFVSPEQQCGRLVGRDALLMCDPGPHP
jgi:hypothetical protein